MREAAQLWTEAYPQLEYRHGPISIAQPGRAVWVFGSPAAGLAGDVDGHRRGPGRRRPGPGHRSDPCPTARSTPRRIGRARSGSAAQPHPVRRPGHDLGVILCVCPSPAIDVTYRLAELVPGATNRIDSVGHRPGGKGVNVARVLHRTGADVDLVLPLGGDSGADLAARPGRGRSAVRRRSRTDVPTRRTVTVVDDGAAPPCCRSPRAIGCWDAFVERVHTRAGHAEVIVISGSLPVDAPAERTGDAARRSRLPDDRRHERPGSGRRRRGAALHSSSRTPRSWPNSPANATRARPREARAGDTRSRSSCPSVRTAYSPSRPTRVWHATPARVLDGNPTGAGDAAVAGLALGLARQGADLPDVLAEAVALAGAAVLHPYAGDLDLDHVREQRRGVTVTRLDPDGASDDTGTHGRPRRGRNRSRQRSRGVERHHSRTRRGDRRSSRANAVAR